ncbi:prolyl aminopeptidase [Pseudoroseomonas globiformis]|uniref:Proline iminopeptidase n=1 Tax=Teichococcus globiformis TaxID=2307229 RepID=A0ABV7G156_9PROT
MYPVLEPYASGDLPVGDGHSLSWEACGHPEGRPALVLHGGPGSGRSATARRYFDPAVFNIVLFDQRGCGRSIPHAGAADADLRTNTTAHLVADIERLRKHLNVADWLLLGGSWGSTLALAYAQQHPERVRAMVLHNVATTTRREVDWITRGVGTFFPREWERFRKGARDVHGNGCLAEAYHRLLMDPDPAVRMKAAQDWCDWETAIVDVTASHKPHPRYADPAFRLAFARLVTHYWRHAAWLEDGILLRRMPELAMLRGTLIHGRLDFGSPLATAWHLAQAWQGSELVVVDEAGHDARDPGMADHIVAAIRRLADA